MQKFYFILKYLNSFNHKPLSYTRWSFGFGFISSQLNKQISVGTTSNSAALQLKGIMSRLKPQQANSLRAGGRNNRKKHYKIKQSQINGTQKLNGLRVDEIRVVHLAASCFSSSFFQMPTTAMQNVCPPKMSNIFSTLGCDCDLNIYCLLSRKISRSDSASS